MAKTKFLGQKFLVTGGAGFIGSEIVRQLLTAGHFVRVADNLSKKDASVDPRAEFLNVDLTKFDEATKAFKDIDICINAAAKIGGIGYFHKYPATILSENNKIYSCTFEAAVKANIKRLVYISSSMVFESTTRFPSKEDDLDKIPPPVSSYGFSKLSGEWYCHSFWDQYKLPYSICRPFNAYGINEFPEREIGYAHVIPDLVRKILGGQYPLELLGDGKQTRCFTHVSDIARGVIAVGLHEKGKNQDFNVGSDEEINMLDLAKRIWKVMGVKKPFKVKYIPGFKFDIKRRVPNVSKIHSTIGWRQEVKFDDGLKEVVLWLKSQKSEGKFDLSQGKMKK
ncbi:MAG: NAD-dependent epimerase/dehydratase family protein [Candidatus Curtissbacteria bacterium]|nr:NAD-dependent epimerase/dehydratase family protein [Candidatus Curtissbacteria bacterium]